jgi:hypothetical protein
LITVTSELLGQSRDFIRKTKLYCYEPHDVGKQSGQDRVEGKVSGTCEMADSNNAPASQTVDRGVLPEYHKRPDDLSEACRWKSIERSVLSDQKLKTSAIVSRRKADDSDGCGT